MGGKELRIDVKLVVLSAVLITLIIACLLYTSSQLPIGDDNHDFAPYAYAIYFNTVFLCVL